MSGSWALFWLNNIKNRATSNWNVLTSCYLVLMKMLKLNSFQIIKNIKDKIHIWKFDGKYISAPNQFKGKRFWWSFCLNIFLFGFLHIFYATSIIKFRKVKYLNGRSNTGVLSSMTVFNDDLSLFAILVGEIFASFLDLFSSIYKIYK